MSLRLAVATEDFGTSLRDSIREAAKCHVSGLRLNARSEIPAEKFSDTALRQLRHYFGECGMQVAGLMFSTRRPLQDPDHLERRLADLRLAMVQVRKLGTTELLVRCGRIPDPDGSAVGSAETGLLAGTPSNSDVNSLRNPFSFAPSAGASRLELSRPTEASQFAMLREVLTDLAQYGNHVGCVLQIQPATYHVERLARLVSEIRTGPLGIVFDPATAVMSGGSPVGIFRDLYRSIGYVRARDAVSDDDGAGVEVAIGDGSVDWQELLPTLSEAEFPGWICMERSGGEDRAEDVRQGVTRICKLLPGPAN